MEQEEQQEVTQYNSSSSSRGWRELRQGKARILDVSRSRVGSDDKGVSFVVQLG